MIEQMHNSIHRYIPLYRDSKKPRVPKQLRLLSKLKLKAYRISKVNPSFLTLFKVLDKLYDLQVKSHIYFMEQKVLSCNNKKLFFSYVNRKLRNSKNCLAPLINTSSEIVTDPKEKANLLNRHFSSIFIADNN